LLQVGASRPAIVGNDPAHESEAEFHSV
jgi:hypothetical protein